MNDREWLEVVPAARRLRISVRQLYDAVDQGRIDARWAGAAGRRRVEVAVDDESAQRLTAPAG